MRILLLDVHYPSFLEHHYDANPELAGRPSSEQLAALMDTYFGKGDAYTRHLRARGHAVEDVIANCLPLQLAWAREHGVRSRVLEYAARLPGRPGRVARSVLLRWLAERRIARFDPDVLYAFDLNFLRSRQLKRLRAGRLLAGQIASAAPPAERLRLFDLLVTSFPHFVERFRALGIRSEYLEIAFHEDVLEKLPPGVDTAPASARPIPVAFVGTLDPGSHQGGTRLLERLAESVDLQVWGYGAEALPDHSPLRRAYQGPAFGLDMYSVLARSKIVINRHIDAAEGFANNMRLYETTGCGALLVTEAAPNLSDLFAPGREVATYSDGDELVEKVRHYLAHDDERVRIATAGRQRTLSDHTYAGRIARLEEIIERHLPAARVP